MKRIGIVFPGYGEQFIGMGKDLYDQFRVVQEFFEQAAGASDINFVKLCFASSAKEILAIENAYVAIYLFECSLYELLYQKGLRPDFVAGYGIGEYAACFASGALSFVDGIYFINKYAKFYGDFAKQKKDYSVLRISRGFTKETLQKLLDELTTDEQFAKIMAQNGEHAFYVVGHKKVIKKIQIYCKKNNIRKVKDIGLGYGMHSFLMDSIVEQLRFYYHKIQFKSLSVPVITNVDGVYVTTPESLQSAMMRKINQPIEWLEVMKGFVGCDIIISVGPGKQLIDWFKDVYPDKEYISVMNLKEIDTISLFLQQNNNETDGFVLQDQETKIKKDLHEVDLQNELPSDYDVEEE
ncbi:acyltransferase domain-containing protein [Candidatus Dependentiae bacterium]|nr:acyltransferase domain-containing protein [Candidatus Dependentiae bacterium]